MKKTVSGFSGYRPSSGWRILGKIGIVCLCFYFVVQKTIKAQPGNKTPAGAISLEVPGLPSDPKDIIWDRLPLLKGERITVFEGEENKSAFCHHPTIFYYKDRFFATWSNGDKDEDFSRQRVMYATSKDGYKWSKATNLTDIIPERAYTPCGFWVRDGELLALASLKNSRASKLVGSDEKVMKAYRWDTARSAFEYSGIIIKDFSAVEGPRQVADGQWLMFGKPGPGAVPPDRTIRYAKGGINAKDNWTIKSLPNDDIEHDIFWYTLSDGNLLSVEATGEIPHRQLVSMFSNDKGNSWSKPVQSNFPDADSRLYGLRLSNGRYVLLNNPNLSRYRIPLSIALSSDGKKFDRIANIRIEQTNKKFSGHAKAPGYQYVRAIEQAGKLWIIYSVNKEDVEITAISLEEIERFYATDQQYDNRKPSIEIIVDNNDKGFTTNPAWPKDTVTGIYDGLRMAYHGPDYACITTTGAEPGWAKWTPEIKKAGVYAVYIKWGQIGFGTKSPMPDVAPVEIKHGGVVQKSSVDQTRYGGTWIYLGSFAMEPGNSSYVKIYSVKDKKTVADAVKFIMME